MVAIFKMQCKKGCYVLAQGTEELVRDFIAEESADDSFGNAGVCAISLSISWWLRITAWRKWRT